MTLFVNNGVLTINNVDVNAYNAVSNTTTGKLDIQDSYIKATNQAIINEGALTIDTSTISGTVYGIYSNSSRADSVTNSTINSNSTAFYKYNLGKSTITTTNINGGVNNNKTGSVLEITSGSINGLVNNIGNTTIKQANIGYVEQYNGSRNLITNSGLLTFENNNVSYTNKTINNSSYSFVTLNNSGTLVSQGNTYTTIYNYNNLNNYNSYRYNYVYGIRNSGILNSVDDSFESYGASSGYGVYNASNNTNAVTNPTMKIHNNNSSFGVRNGSGKVSVVNGTIEVYTSSTGYGTYTDAGTPTITGTSIYVHDNSSTSYGSYINGGALTIESGNTLITGGTVYGTYTANGSSTLVLGIEDGRGIDAADVSTETPYIKAIGTSTGVGVRTGDGFLAFYDGYFTGSTSPRLATDTTSLIEKNYQVVTKQDEETGYNYCILEFIK